MGSKWRKVKLAFGLNLCVYTPTNHVADNDDDDDSPPPSERRSDAALLSPTSAPSSNRLRLSKSLSRSSSKVSFHLFLTTINYVPNSVFFLCLLILVVCLLADKSGNL